MPLPPRTAHKGELGILIIEMAQGFKRFPRRKSDHAQHQKTSNEDEWLCHVSSPSNLPTFIYLVTHKNQR